MQIILVHGFGCNATDWSAQREALNDFADVAALDFQEAEMSQSAGVSSVIGMADCVNEWRRASGTVPCVLVGHSMGCRVILEAARRLPDTVRGLVLIEGSLRAVGDPAEAVRRYLSRTIEENKALLMHDFAGMFSDATSAAFRNHVLRRAAAMSGPYAVRLMADMTFWDAAEAASALQAVRAPMLILQSTFKEPGGERRPIKRGETSPWMQLVAENAPGQVQTTRLTGLGHFPQVEEPQAVNKIISDFVVSLAS